MLILQIYVPVLYEDHYILFVIDHLKQKVQYLDNRIWSEEKIVIFRDLSFDVVIFNFILAVKLLFFLVIYLNLLKHWKSNFVVIKWSSRKYLPHDSCCYILFAHGFQKFAASAWKGESFAAFGVANAWPSLFTTMLLFF